MTDANPPSDGLFPGLSKEKQLQDIFLLEHLLHELSSQKKQEQSYLGALIATMALLFPLSIWNHYNISWLGSSSNTGLFYTFLSCFPLVLCTTGVLLLFSSIKKFYTSSNRLAGCNRVLSEFNIHFDTVNHKLYHCKPKPHLQQNLGPYSRVQEVPQAPAGRLVRTPIPSEISSNSTSHYIPSSPSTFLVSQANTGSQLSSTDQNSNMSKPDSVLIGIQQAPPESHLRLSRNSSLHY